LKKHQKEPMKIKAVKYQKKNDELCRTVRELKQTIVQLQKKIKQLENDLVDKRRERKEEKVKKEVSIVPVEKKRSNISIRLPDRQKELEDREAVRKKWADWNKNRTQGEKE
jgi:uncharacterized protein YlxW (UPF0749 family)